MKKAIAVVAGFVLTLVSVSSLNAQTDPQPVSTPQQVWDAKKNPTVDSIAAKYQGRLIAARPALTNADFFPVIGNYQSSSEAVVVTDANVNVTTTTVATPSEANVMIILDEQNKGLVWIEGLPQGRIKAHLRQSPAVYKIPAQKSESGKDVKEGVLIYDPTTNQLNVCIGCTYNAENPSAAFVSSTTSEEPEVKVVKKKGTKTKAVAKAKPFYFSGTKIIETTASTTTEIPQQQ